MLNYNYPFVFLKGIIMKKISRRKFISFAAISALGFPLSINASQDKKIMKNLMNITMLLLLEVELVHIFVQPILQKIKLMFL